MVARRRCPSTGGRNWYIPRRTPVRTRSPSAPSGRGGMVVLVVEGEVEEPVLFLVPEDSAYRLFDDDRELVCEGRVVDAGCRVGRGKQRGVAVVMLEALSLEGGPAGGAAGEDAAAPNVAERPGQVADPLETEHRVKEVDRQHRMGPGRVGRCQRDEAGHGAGLGDAFLEDLAGLALRVPQCEVGVDRRVALAFGGIDLGLRDD